jgi:hypothetical protein
MSRGLRRISRATLVTKFAWTGLVIPVDYPQIHESIRTERRLVAQSTATLVALP